MIVGHSERRSGHSETSHEVRAKASAALKAGLPVIVCLGETKGEREAGLAPAVCTRQLIDSLPAESTPENTVIAYEPVWAIGTGLQATTDDITAIHALLRAELGKREGTAAQRWRILYGGSVSPANAAGHFRKQRGRWRPGWRCKLEGRLVPCNYRGRSGSLGAPEVLIVEGANE